MPKGFGLLQSTIMILRVLKVFISLLAIQGFLFSCTLAVAQPYQFNIHYYSNVFLSGGYDSHFWIGSNKIYSIQTVGSTQLTEKKNKVKEGTNTYISQSTSFSSSLETSLIPEKESCVENSFEYCDWKYTGDENSSCKNNGIKVCQNGEWSSCNPPDLNSLVELCNNIDDDCDGEIDEDDVCITSCVQDFSAGSNHTCATLKNGKA